MLQCPLCATRYADGITACPLDHGALVAVPPPGEYGPRWTPGPGALAISSRGSAALAPGASSGEPGAEPAAVDPLVGQILGSKLRVLRRIGQGGMGTVYVAEHVGLGKQVAVKVLSAPEVRGDAGAGQPEPASELVRRLHTEARHTAAIKNEHIVEIFDIGTTAQDRPYVEMELLTGESLAQRLARCSALSEADTLRVGRQLASALAAAHNSGIVHRDIKPENIFLCTPSAYGKDPSEGDFVKVLDFGISKAVRSPETDAVLADGQPKAARETRLTRTGAILGTPLYMSPEQVRGEPLDHRVDVYAVGVVLYECLTGSVPHGACNYLAVAAKILTEAPEPPSQRSPERSISPELEHIVLRAMATQRKDRYQTMEALHEDLRRYACGQELQPRSQPAIAPAALAAAASAAHGGALGHLWRPILVGMVLVLALGGGVAAVLRPRGPWSAASDETTPRAEPRASGRPPGAVTNQLPGQPLGPGAAPDSSAKARAGGAGWLVSQGGSLSAVPGATVQRRSETDPQQAAATKPASADFSATPSSPAAASASGDGISHPTAHRRLRPASAAAPSNLSSLRDEPLLDEQAPNPFVTPQAASSAAAAGPPAGDVAADDTSAFPR